MKILPNTQFKHIFGGTKVYVTQEWKDNDAMVTGGILGTVLGIYGGLGGGALGMINNHPILYGCYGLQIGGLIGFGSGYKLSRLETDQLQNNTYHNLVKVRT